MRLVEFLLLGALEWVHEYRAILFGLLVGVVTHYGIRIADGEEITKRQVVGYLMQLGFVGLLAVVALRVFEINDEDLKAFTTAILAVSAQEVVKYARRRASWKHIVDAGTGKDD